MRGAHAESVFFRRKIVLPTLEGRMRGSEFGESKDEGRSRLLPAQRVFLALLKEERSARLERS